MTLANLLAALPAARVIGDADLAVGRVCNDSRAIAPGDVYVAVRGMRADGHAFVAAAIERGAVAVVVEHEVEVAVPQVIVADGAVALGVLVGRALGDPARAMTLVGITGTNGKTTTTYVVESILRAAGARPGVIGTVEYRWRDRNDDVVTMDAPFTTPTPQVLHDTFAAMRDAGTTHVVMEVSSSALAMARLAGVTFTVAAFSNLTQDHLDLHGSMAAYRDAKRLLFSNHLGAGTAVVNVDDPEGDGMAAAAHGRVLRVSAEGGAADLRVVEQHSTVRGITARIARARSTSTANGRGTPARIWSRIMRGSSVRGLSLVTTARSASAATSAPILGRLPGSRSPPQPNTQISRRRVSGRSAPSTLRSASGVWA